MRREHLRKLRRSEKKLRAKVRAQQAPVQTIVSVKPSRPDLAAAFSTATLTAAQERFGSMMGALARKTGT